MSSPKVTPSLYEQQENEENKQNDNNNNNNENQIIMQNKQQRNQPLLSSNLNNNINNNNKFNLNDDDSLIMSRHVKNNNSLQDLSGAKIQVMNEDSFAFTPGKFLFNDKKANDYIKNFSKEAMQEVEKAFNDEQFQKALAYCATQRMGGKFRSIRKSHEAVIDSYLTQVKLYHNSLKTSYKGLLKYAPYHVMAIWKANKPTDAMYNDINKYANGLETQFQFEDLKALHLNEKEIKFCYLKLVKQLEILVNKPKNDDNWKKLVSRYVNFERGYEIGSLRDSKDISNLLQEVKRLDINTGGKINIANLL